jgi:hypothetical protein
MVTSASLQVVHWRRMRQDPFFSGRYLVMANGVLRAYPFVFHTRETYRMEHGSSAAHDSITFVATEVDVHGMLSTARQGASRRSRPVGRLNTLLT